MFTFRQAAALNGGRNVSMTEREHAGAAASGVRAFGPLKLAANPSRP
jgi:hypothetical protein